MSNKKQGSYDSQNIKVLEGLTAVRKRPGMYIGSTGHRGLHHMIQEVVDNSIDEAMAEHCDEIKVTIHEDSSVSVEDNGRGIPVSIHKDTGLPGVELVMTKLHAGGKFDKDNYKVSGGLHGVGVSVVNALSSKLEATVYRDNKEYSISFERGLTKQKLKEVGPTNKRGTLVRFWADTEIFETLDDDSSLVQTRLRELAFLNKGTKIIFKDERPGFEKESEFKYEGGIVSFVEHLNKGKNVLTNTVYFTKEKDNVTVDICLQYNDSYSDSVFSFVNNINTHEGGTHVSGFKTALTRTLNNYAENNKLLKEKDSRFSSDDVHEGLACIISVKVPEPQFEGQTKTKLGNSEVKGIVDSVVFTKLTEFLEENPSAARAIIEKCLSTARAREAATKARELVRRKSVLESSTLPGKLADCSTKNKEAAELYIVEGDSAGGSAKQARSREFQAILPLRGKILNVEKAHLGKAIRNKEIQALITAVGTSLSDDFDPDKLRYGKIIIMTDADVDGAHIRTLLLTFFFRYMKTLIEQGRVYIAQPPLYKLQKGKRIHYVHTDEELEALLSKIGRDGFSFQRYKGLGEMNPDQLWETTMDPERRTLIQVTIEDAVQADKLFTILMGTEVEPRRDFIEKHALEVQNLDL